MAEMLRSARGNVGKGESSARYLADRLHSFHALLTNAISGIEESGVRSRYAALLLHRCLFLHILQQMGLFADDCDYLQHCFRQHQDQQETGVDFYHSFLLPHFINKDNSATSLAHLFPSHCIEQSHPRIAIEDAFFAQFFAFFAENWRQPDQEIALAISERLFEQSLHSAEMGAYYTPATITAYIVRNTLLPALFTRTRERCTSHASLSDEFFWRQLRMQPERYLFRGARKGFEYTLPRAIATGLQDMRHRQNWQEFAPEAYALPGETWREVIARRAQVETLLADISKETAARLDRLVTWNLNAQALVVDALQQCQRPEIVEAFYQSLRQLTILDPTCGAGAFLCAALPQLQALYLTCLDRMEELCDHTASAPITVVKRMQA